MVKTSGIVGCSNEGVTYTFLDKVFSRFGAPIKVFTNEGTKICEEFQEFCEKALINHCTISQDDPKANMLTEWMVQMMK
jgi:hypothetical protein